MPMNLSRLSLFALTCTLWVVHGCTAGGTPSPPTVGGASENTSQGITVPLIRIEDEPAGENCPAGGVAVAAGIDDDEDGLLGTDEVQERFYVCHGEDGAVGDAGAAGAEGAAGTAGDKGDAGDEALVRLTDEDPGDNCVDGGVKVESGVDGDGDEALSDDEVQFVAYVCHGGRGGDGAEGPAGAQGPPGEDGEQGPPGDGGEGGGPHLALRITPLDPGPECPGGGFKLEAGPDLDGDGELDDEEVRQTGIACNGSLCESPLWHDGGDGSCIPVGSCLEGFHDGGDGTCLPAGECIEGLRDGGGGRCVPEGECAPDFRPDPLGGAGCVPACDEGEHDDGEGVCVPEGECAIDYHDGGDGTCVAAALCVEGFRDGGDGRCAPQGECSFRYIDVNGVCVANEELLFDFDAHTFTTCGASGRSGPSIDQCAAAYDAAEWADDRDIFDVAGGIQWWMVPEDGTYRIEAWGAQGGSNGGNGARIRGDVELAGGTVLRILVGQQGGAAPAAVGNGGGGGSFVVGPGDVPLIIAGGGGGTGHNSHRADEVTFHGQVGGNGNPGTHDGRGDGGQNGNGGAEGHTTQGIPNAGGGGGLLTDGGSDGAAHGGQAFVNGGLGGDSTGGFGGGGGSNLFIYGCGSSPHGGSGGGGYSGGGGGGNNCNGIGGGGGSFNAGANPSSQVGARAGQGQVTITLLRPE